MVSDSGARDSKEDIDHIMMDLLNVDSPQKSDSPVPKHSPSETPRQGFEVQLPQSLFLTPPSCYELFKPPERLVSERSAVDMLLREWHRVGLTDTSSGYIEFHLNNFSVYCDKEHYPLEMLRYKDAYFHALWKEALLLTQCKPEPLTRGLHPPTIVTDYIYDCFEHMPFGDRLQHMPLGAETRRHSGRLIAERHLEMPVPLHEQVKNLSLAPADRIHAVEIGNTISTQRDGAGSGTKWEREVSKGFGDVDRWFTLVLKVRTN